jgi:hypothetical protein
VSLLYQPRREGNKRERKREEEKTKSGFLAAWPYTQLFLASRWTFRPAVAWPFAQLLCAIKS